MIFFVLFLRNWIVDGKIPAIRYCILVLPMAYFVCFSFFDRKTAAYAQFLTEVMYNCPVIHRVIGSVFLCCNLKKFTILQVCAIIINGY